MQALVQAIRPRLVAWGLLVLSLSALAAALLSQYGGGLQPCVLCLWQRVPFVVVAVLSLIALLRPVSLTPMLALCALALLINAGIATFHVGVEQHWWSGPGTCSTDLARGLSDLNAADFLMALDTPAPVPCDQPPWTLFGVSMAGYNVLLCAGVSAALLFWLGMTRRHKRP